MILRFLAFAAISSAFLAGCRTIQDPQEVVFSPTIVLDERCAGLLNNTFQTRTNEQPGEIGGETVFTPILVSFLLDGRVIWKYENETSYIGTFTCELGAVEATFDEGSRRAFSAVYDSEAGIVFIDGEIYQVVEGQ